MRSRVIPGSSPTMARRDPTMRLNSVDLPTLGRPTMAMVGTPSTIGVLSELDLIRVMRAVVGRASLVVGLCPFAVGCWPLAKPQGLNRVQRARNFYRSAVKRRATQNRKPCQSRNHRPWSFGQRRTAKSQRLPFKTSKVSGPHGLSQRTDCRYYRDSDVFPFAARFGSSAWRAEIRCLAVSVLFSWRRAVAHPSGLRISPRTTANGAGGGTGAGRKTPFDRGSRHRHGKNFGVSGACDSLRQA